MEGRTCSPNWLSSMFFTLWKSYLFNCRTKLAKFECLNMRGRMDFVNSFMSYSEMIRCD